MPNVSELFPEPIRRVSGQLSRCMLDRAQIGQTVNGNCETPECDYFIYHLDDDRVLGGTADMVLDCVRRQLTNRMKIHFERDKDLVVSPHPTNSALPPPKVRPRWLDEPLEEFRPIK